MPRDLIEWSVNNGTGNGLVLEGKKLLPKPTWIQVTDAYMHHQDQGLKKLKAVSRFTHYSQTIYFKFWTFLYISFLQFWTFGKIHMDCTTILPCIMMTLSNGNISSVLALCAGNSPVTVEFPSKGQWRRGLMFSLICAWTNGWANNRDAGDLRRHRAHYDVTVMH